MITRSEYSLEAAENRRRFAREGIALVVGDRKTRYPVRTEYGSEIAIRPGYHIDTPRSERLDAILDGTFTAFEKPVTWLAAGAFTAIAIDLVFAVLR